MEKPEISSKSTYDRVKMACEYILDSEGKSSSKNSLSSAELFEKVKIEFNEEFPEDFAKNTFYQYLSNTVKDTESSINCLGRRKGYYLSSLAEEAIPEETEGATTASTALNESTSESSVAESPQKRAQKEILLYPLLESWLIAQGYQAEDVSSGRSLGKWGNPDVAGISVIGAENSIH